MVTAITCAELAAMIPHLPEGEMREWCEQSSKGIAHHRGLCKQRNALSLSCRTNGLV